VSTQRRDKESTRQLLLDAGFEMMLERGLDVGWGIRVADVTERVGLTTGAAYQIWSGSRTRDGRGGQDKFHRDLALHAIERLIAERAAVTPRPSNKRSDGARSLEPSCNR
jgi:AcrR family transcriptional regulator